MQEDIKILEEKLKIIESLCTDDCINKSTVIQPLKHAIENLIAKNKELEFKKKVAENTVKSLENDLFSVKKNGFYQLEDFEQTGNHIPKID